MQKTQYLAAVVLTEDIHTGLCLDETIRSKSRELGEHLVLNRRHVLKAHRLEASEEGGIKLAGHRFVRLRIVIS